MNGIHSDKEYDEMGRKKSEAETLPRIFFWGTVITLVVMGAGIYCLWVGLTHF